MDPYAQGLIFFLVLQIVAASFRVYVRVFLVKNFGWDDAAMLFTLLLACAFDCMILGIVRLTNLKSLIYIEPKHLIPAIRLTLAVECMYIWAATFLKLALGLLLLRVLVVRWQRMTIYVIMAVCFAYGTFYFFFILFQCGSPYDFPKRIVLGQCLSRTAIDGTSFTHAAINAVADCTFLSLPFALLWKTDMSRRAKLSVIGILGVGSVGGIVSIIRVGYIDTLTKATVTYFETSRVIVLMSSAELSIALTCICLSTLKPLISRIWPGTTLYTRQERDTTGQRSTYIEMSESSQWARRSTQGSKKSSVTVESIAKNAGVRELVLEVPASPETRSTLAATTTAGPGPATHPLRIQPPV